MTKYFRNSLHVYVISFTDLTQELLELYPLVALDYISRDEYEYENSASIFLSTHSFIYVLIIQVLVSFQRQSDIYVKPAFIDNVTTFRLRSTKGSLIAVGEVVKRVTTNAPGNTRPFTNPAAAIASST